MERQVYKIITPQGKKIKCGNLAAFAQRHNLPINKIYPGVRRPRKHQGYLISIWRVRLNVPHYRRRPKPEVKQRACLRCRKEFSSTGNGNRVCGPCRYLNNDQDTVTSYSLCM